MAYFLNNEPVEVDKPGDANHGREGWVGGQVETPPGPWPTRRYKVKFEDGQEEGEYAEFQLRRTKPIKKVGT